MDIAIMVLEIPQLHSPTVVSTVSNGNAFLECTDISLEQFPGCRRNGLAASRVQTVTSAAR